MVVISCSLQLLVSDGGRLHEDKVLLINVELSTEVVKQFSDNREVVKLGWEMLLLFWKVSTLNFAREIFTSFVVGKVFKTFDCLRLVFSESLSSNFSLLVLSFFSKTCTLLSAAILSLLSSLMLSFKFLIVSVKLSILFWRL